MDLSRPVKFDAKYKISDRKHISHLPETSLEQLGVLLQSGSVGVGASSWKALACQLGLSNADVQAIESAATSNPGYEALKKWRFKPLSTVLVLREKLAAVGRNDVIAQLEKMLFDLVHLTIVLYDNYGRTLYNFSGKCPAKMPLIEFVRPQLIRKMSTELLLQPRDKPIVILLRRVPAESEMTWTTRADDFRGKHVALEKSVTPPRERSDRLRLLKNAVRPERCVVSESGDTCVYFDVIDDVIADDTSSRRSSRSSSLESPVDEDDQPQQPSLGGGVDDASFAGSPPIQEEQEEGQQEVEAVKEEGEPPGCSAADGSLELHENLLLKPSASGAVVAVERKMADCRL